VPEKASPCRVWISYFDQLKKELGKDNARLIWLYTWSVKGAISCTTSPSFNKWLKQNDIDVSNAATRTVADFTQIGHNLFGLGKRLTGVLSIGLPLGIGAALLVVIIILIRSARSVEVSDAIGLLPQGKLLSKSIPR